MEPQKKNLEGFGAGQTQPPGKLAEALQQAMASQERKEKETEECLKLASEDKNTVSTVSTVNSDTEKGFGAGLASFRAKETLETPGKEILPGKSCKEAGREEFFQSALKEQGVAAMAETETACKGSTNLLEGELKGDSGLQEEIQGKEDIQNPQGTDFVLQKEASSHLGEKQTQPAKLKVNSGLLKPAVTMETGPEEGGGKTLGLATAENFLQDFFFFNQYKETYCLNAEKLGEFLGLLEESTQEFELETVFTDPEEATECLQRDFYLREMQNRAYLGVDSIREALQELNDYGRSLLRKPVGERRQEEYESLVNIVTGINEQNEEVKRDLQVYKERKGLLLDQFVFKNKEEKSKENTKIRRDREPKPPSRKFLVEEALNTSRDRSPLKPGSCSAEELCPVSLFKTKHAQPRNPEKAEKEACAGQLAGTVLFNPIKPTNEPGSEGVERLEGPSFQERRESGMECSGVSSLLASSESSVESSSEEEEMEEEGAGGESQKKRAKRKTVEGGKGLSPGKKVTKDYLIGQYDTDFQSVEEGEGAEREGTLSEGSKNTILSRERQISAAWTECLHTPWNKATDIILPKEFDKYDTLKLWGYTVAHIALPGSKERLPSFRKYSRDKLWGILEKSFPLLKSVLSGLRVEQSQEQVSYARTLALEIVERLLLGRKPKTSVIVLPDWLREDQLTKTFQEIHRTWECAPENQTPLVWTQMDNTSKMASREAWMEWLLMVTADLRQRRKIAKQSGFDLTEEKAKGTRQEKIKEKLKNWKEPDPALRLERSPAGREALSFNLGACATVPPPATGEDPREARGRREVQRMGSHVRREGVGNVGLRGTLSDISDSDLERGVSARVSKKPRREQAWGDRVDTEVGLVAGEGGNGIGVGEQREGLAWDGVAVGTSMEDAAGLGVSFPQGEQNNPLLTTEMRTRVPGARPKRLLEDTDASGNGRFPTRPRMDSETDVTSKGKSVSLNPPPDRHRNEREGDDTRGDDTRGEAPRGASALPPGLPGGRTGGKPQEQRKDRTYASIAGRGTGTAGPSNISGLTEEEEEYLDSFFHQASDVRNPRTRYVVRFRYLGSDPERGSRAYISKRLLRDTLDAPREDIVAVIQLPGSREIDVCLASEKVYREFWMKCKTVKRLSPELLTEYEMVPLFRGDTKVLTVSFRTTTIPAQDVARWVSKYATILSGPDKKEDEQGYWTGEYRCVVSFKNEDPEYRHGKIPKYFFLGADRGITRYSGQPQACFHCGSYDHQRRLCTTPLCSRCGAKGHPTVACHSSIRCNFCGELGHTYFWCPQAYYNQQDAKIFEKAQQVARTGKERAQSREQARLLRDTLRGRGEELLSVKRRENRESNHGPGPLPENRQQETVKEGKDSGWNIVPGKGVGRIDGDPQRKEKVSEEAVRGHNRFCVLAEEEGRVEEETGSVPKEFSDRELLVAVEGAGDRQPKQAGGAKGQRSPRRPRSKRHGTTRNQVVDQESEESKAKGKVVGSGESVVEGQAVLLSGGSPEGLPEEMVREIVREETFGEESVASPPLLSEEVGVCMQELDGRLMRLPDAESGLCFPPPLPPPPYPGPPDALPCPLPSRPPDPDGSVSASSSLVSPTAPNFSPISETTPSGLPEEVERSQLETMNPRDREARETESLEIELEIELD